MNYIIILTETAVFCLENSIWSFYPIWPASGLRSVAPMFLLANTLSHWASNKLSVGIWWPGIEWLILCWWKAGRHWKGFNTSWDYVSWIYSLSWIWPQVWEEYITTSWSCLDINMFSLVSIWVSDQTSSSKGANLILWALPIENEVWKNIFQLL